MSTLRHATDVETAPVAALGLLGGYVTARASGVRALGTVPLAFGLGWAARTWHAKQGPATAAVLGTLYVAAFAGSHPLAKRIGAWPSVFAVTGAVAAACHLVVDARPVRGRR